MPTFLRAVVLASLFACASAPQGKPGGAAPSGAALTAEQASAHVGETVAVEFTIVKVGVSKGESTFLNSTRDRGGFVGFIPRSAHAAFTAAFGDDLRAALEGKTVRITGEVALYKDSPQIVLKATEQLTVVK